MRVLLFHLALEEMSALIDETRKLLKSVPKPTLLDLRSRWSLDLTRMKHPSPRRIFKKLAPDLNAQVHKLVDRLVSGNNVRHTTVDAILNLILSGSSFKKCPCCGSSFLTGQYCSSSCASRHAAHAPEARTLRRQTTRMKYGVENVAQVPRLIRKRLKTRAQNCPESEIKRKRELTSLRKHGVRNAGGTEESLSRAKQSILERFGSHEEYVKHLLSANERTCLERYGESSILKTDLFRRKAKKTWKRKYGVDHPMKSPEFFQQHMKALHRKFRVRVGNRVLTLQSSYEVEVAQHLSSIGWAVRSPLISIPYSYGGQRRRYHADLIANRDGKRYMIEVKSPYTLQKDLERNLKKFRAANRFCRQRGAQFTLCVVKKAAGQDPQTIICNFPTRARLIELGLIT